MWNQPLHNCFRPIIFSVAVQLQEDKKLQQRVG